MTQRYTHSSFFNPHLTHNALAYSPIASLKDLNTNTSGSNTIATIETYLEKTSYVRFWEQQRQQQAKKCGLHFKKKYILHTDFSHEEDGLTLSKISPFFIDIKAFIDVGGKSTSIRKLRNST